MSHEGDSQSAEEASDALARKTTYITIITCVLFIAAVYFYVL